MNLKYLSLNYSQTWWYKVLAILLVVALILAVSFGTVQHAGAIAITATVAASILAVMAGAGIYTVVSGMTSSQIQNWLSVKLDDWDLSRNDGHDWTYYIDHNLIVSTVKGLLRIGTSAASGISDFISWLQTDIGLQDNDSVDVVSPGLYLSGVPVLEVPFTYNSYAPWGNDPVSISIVNHSSDCYFYWYSSGDGTYTAYVISSKVSGPFTQIYYRMDGHGSGTATIDNVGVSGSFVSLGNYSQSYLTLSSVVSSIPVQSIVGSPSLTPSEVGGFSLSSGSIAIPSIDDGEDILIGISGAYPGSTTDQVCDEILNDVLSNELDVDMTVTNEFVDAQEVVIVNELPLTVNTDHHGFAFDLPEISFNFSSIWHYVTDAVSYASGFISWFVGLLSSVPALAIPLYMSFTLVVVLGALRRFVL